MLWVDAFVLVYAINDQSSFDELMQVRLNVGDTRRQLPSSKSTFFQSFKMKCISEEVRIGIV